MLLLPRRNACVMAKIAITVKSGNHRIDSALLHRVRDETNVSFLQGKYFFFFLFFFYPWIWHFDVETREQRHHAPRKPETHTQR